MTLFNYLDLLGEPKPGERPWQDSPTNVNWKKIMERGKGKPTFASVAGDALDQVEALHRPAGQAHGHRQLPSPACAGRGLPA